MNKNCFFHNDKKATNICYSCGHYFCDDCLSYKEGFYICKNDGCKVAYLIQKQKEENKKTNFFTKVRELPSILTRLSNYLLDRFAIFFIQITALNQLYQKLNPNENNLDLLILISIDLTIAFLYYFIFETFFQKTLGKFLTGTKVVTIDGLRPNAKIIALRTILRFLPLEMFSISNRTWWHDRLSKTRVVSIKYYYS